MRTCCYCDCVDMLTFAGHESASVLERRDLAATKQLNIVNNTPCTPSVRMIVMAETFLTTKFTGITVCSGSHAYGKLRIFWSSEQSISVISMFRHFYNLELSECKGGGQIIKHLYNLMPCIKYCFCGSEAGHL